MINEFLFEYDFRENESYNLEAEFDFNEDLVNPINIEADLSIQNVLVADLGDIQINQEFIAN